MLSILIDFMFEVLYCSSIDAVEKFWLKLGFEVRKVNKSICIVEISGIELHYVLESEEPFEAYEFATEKLGRGSGVLHYFEHAELENLKVEVVSSGVKSTAIARNHWDGEEFLFADPDGYLFVAYRMVTK